MAARLLALGAVLGRGLAMSLARPKHPWPCKNGNAMRTGQGRFSGVGTRNLSAASWVFDVESVSDDDAFYQSPVIDVGRNAYFSSTNGKYYSVAPDGRLNWATQLRRETRAAGQMPTPVLYGDALYTVDGQGWVVALALASGAELWRARYAFSSGIDSWSMGLDAGSGTLFAPGSPTEVDALRCMFGGSHLFALDLNTGRTKWTYRFQECTCNVMPAVAGGQLVFSDASGIVYALDAASGAPRWIAPGNGPFAFTTGTAAIGPNGLLYVTSNLGPHRGVLRAYDLKGGALRWQRTFDREANNAPAVFRDGRGRLLVAIGISDNAGYPMGQPASFNGTLYALDAATGSTAWSFSPPTWRHPAAAGSALGQLCMPDAFTNPSVDAGGTLYIGWMGGVAYGLDGATGRELSSWETRSGMQGAPGVADGMLVVSSCKRMAGFVLRP